MRSRPIRTPVAATAVAMAGVLSFFAACSSDPTSTGPDDNPVPENQIPVADAGSDVTVSATVPVTLDGSGSSDADGDALTYEWSLVSTPSGSQAALDDATLAAPSFTPDLPGEYVARLVVNDGTEDSQSDDVTVTAEDNTAAAMIEAATGGEVTSLDGSVTLSIPAGALDSDTEIKVTAVPRAQYEPRFGDLGEGAVVYDLQPDGLQFLQPAELALDVPLDTFSPESVQVGLPLLFSVWGDSVEILDNFAIEVSTDSPVATASADLKHFSTAIYPGSEAARFDRYLIAKVEGVPDESEVDVVFDVSVTLKANGPEITLTGGTVTDESVTPVEFVGPFDSDVGDGKADHLYACSQPGLGKYRSVVEADFLIDPAFDETAFADLYLRLPVGRSSAKATLKFLKLVTCKTGARVSPFLEFGIPLVDRITRFDAGAADPAAPIVAAFPAGAIVATGAGEPTVKLLGIPPSVTAVYAAVGEAAKGVLLATKAGLYEVAGPIPILHDTPVPEMSFVKAEATVVGITDNSGNTTDVLAFNNDPSTGEYAVVQRDDGNIYFGRFADGGGFQGDPTMLEVWYDQGQSVFPDPPQSAYLGPNGFTAEDPMLVVTVAGGELATSTLYLVQLVGGVAQLTPASELAPPDRARMVRCLDDVCAISSYGSELGFGGMTYFRWDGGMNITPIGNRLGSRPVGFDMVVHASGNTLVASTDFFGTEYFIDEIDPNGQLVSSNSYLLPEGCTGAGSVLFRTPGEVIISCNISGLVTSDNAFAQ